MVFFATGIGWLYLAAAAAGGHAERQAAVLALVWAVFTLSILVSSINPLIVPALAVAAAAAVAIRKWQVLVAGPLTAPFGYSSAAGAFFMLAATAALILAVRANAWMARVMAATLAIAFALVPFLNGTRTAVALMVLFPLALLPREPGVTRRAIGASAAVPLLALLTVVLLGATYRPGEPLGRVGRAVDATLSERRLELWHDALLTFIRNPIRGVGPELYPEVSEVAQKEHHTRWPHSEPLHFAAESGLPGLLIIIGAFGFGFAWLWRQSPDRSHTVAAFGLAAIGVHANVDYVLHYPAVPLLAAAIVGTGVTDHRRSVGLAAMISPR
jgi:O-antigen ligase